MLKPNNFLKCSYPQLLDKMVEFYLSFLKRNKIITDILRKTGEKEINALF